MSGYFDERLPPGRCPHCGFTLEPEPAEPKNRQAPSPLRLADLELDPLGMIVRRAGRRLALTPREYRLLELLLRNRNRVLSRHVIFDRLWSDGAANSPKIVDVYMAYIRAKVDHDRRPKLLHTVRGIGYVLRIDDEGTGERSLVFADRT
jgi:DNA-binding response OmpR family regulator